MAQPFQINKLIRFRLPGPALMLCLSAFIGAIFAEYAPNIRPDPQLDAFIIGLSTEHGIPLPASFFTQPYNVKAFISFVNQADSLAQAGKLSTEEKKWLDRAAKWISGGTSVFSWNKKDPEIESHINLSLMGKMRAGYDDRALLAIRGTASPGFNGAIGPLSFFSSVDVSTDYRYDSIYQRSSYQPYSGVPYNLYGRADSSHFRSTDMLRGGVRLTHDWIQIETAVDYLKQGPCVYNPLTFSGFAPPLTYFRDRLDLFLVNYTQTFGYLRADRDLPKYFYTQRLDIPIKKAYANIGISEVVITGSTINQPAPGSPGADSLRTEYYDKKRGWEWAYMIPFVPYTFAEHYAGDRDNKAVSFDVNLSIPAGFRWYGELFVDDYTNPWSIFSDDWGNKLAFTVGGEYYGSLLTKDISASIEYCRVEPWVYTHFYGESHRYTHFGQSLGAPLGPNSDALHMNAFITLNDLHAVGLTFGNFRTNQSVRGGKITDVFQEHRADSMQNDSPKKHFLGNGTIRSTQIGIQWHFIPFGRYRMQAWLGYDVGDNPGMLVSASGGFVF